MCDGSIRLLVSAKCDSRVRGTRKKIRVLNCSYKAEETVLPEGKKEHETELLN